MATNRVTDKGRSPPTSSKGEDRGRYFPVEQDCQYCKLSSYNLKTCSKCWWAKYCNEKCQLKHWHQHKLVCKADPSQRHYYKGGRMVELDMAGNTEAPEVSSNEDALYVDLHQCPKNGYNNHANFTSVTDFRLEHLPEKIRRQEVLDYIMAEAKTTVRLLVKWTSDKRPENDVCAKFKATRHCRTASGNYVLDNAKDFQPEICCIPNCHRVADLGENHVIYKGDLKIFTNKHVLYDDNELANTVIDFFYDRADMVGVVREYATMLYYTKPSSDKTFLKVTIHDKEMLHRLVQYDLDRSMAYNKLSPKVLEEMSSFATVISHPHGTPKKISVGRVLKVTEENMSEETMTNARLAGHLEKKWFASRKEEDYAVYMQCLREKDLPVYKVWYDTPTCQGSSGAPVLYGSRMCKGVWGPFIANHSAYDIDSGLNFFKVVRFA